MILSIKNRLWKAEVSLHAGQFLQCCHKDSPYPVVWLWKKPSYAPGSSIRGGYPVCCPWFGASPVPERPIKGSARQHEWKLSAHEDDYVRMDLRDFPFELQNELRLSDQLEMTFSMKNCGKDPLRITMALHTYLAVSDCTKIRIGGMENIPYTVKGGPEHPGEKDSLKIQGECCRLYYPHSGQSEINDPEWLRKYHLLSIFHITIGWFFLNNFRFISDSDIDKSHRCDYNKKQGRKMDFHDMP